MADCREKGHGTESRQQRAPNTERRAQSNGSRSTEDREESRGRRRAQRIDSREPGQRTKSTEQSPQSTAGTRLVSAQGLSARLVRQTRATAPVHNWTGATAPFHTWTGVRRRHQGAERLAWTEHSRARRPERIAESSDKGQRSKSKTRQRPRLVSTEPRAGPPDPRGEQGSENPSQT